MKPVIIIGSGMAGYTVARELRKLDGAVPITIISRDGGDFYSKPMLSNAYQMGKSAASLVNFTAQQMAEQLNATVLPHALVRAIDTASQSVMLAPNGDDAEAAPLPYRALVLAVGADQRRPALAGSGVADILTVNDLDDYGRMRAALEGCRRVVLLGAGLIGCEFANDLAMAGMQVSLVDPGGWPLSRLLPAPQGQAMAAALEGIGVQLHLGVTPQSVERSAAGYQVALSDGTTLGAHKVIAAIGLAPRIDLARASGIAVARGIVTDGWLSTSADKVYAIGDCAEVEGEVLPYIMPIMVAARALAHTLTGKPTRVNYPVMPVQVKTPVLPAVVAAPPAMAEGTWRARQPDGVWEYRDSHNAMHGFALTGSSVGERAAMLKAMAVRG